MCASAVLVLLFALTGPATLPATRPAAIDLSSPDATIHSYISAMEQGDLRAYDRIVLTQSDAERQIMRAGARMDMAAQRLVSATERKLGGAAALELRQGLGLFGLGPSPAAAESLREALDEADWNHVDDDEAVLGEVIPEVRVKLVDGDWRLLMRVEETGDELQERLAQMERLTNWLEQIAQQVDRGQLKSIDEIGRLLTSPRPEPPATAPSSPSTGP